VRSEQIGCCTLYLGDNRDVIPQMGEFNAVVTDPPYGIEDMVGGYGRKGLTIANDKSLDVCRETLQMAWSAMDRGWLAAFYSSRVTPEFIGILPPDDYFGEVIWDKCTPGMGANVRYQHENIAVYRKGDAESLKTIFSVIRYNRIASEHPHQKPVEVMQNLCEMTGGIVLDPFMGSGSTGVACQRLGIPFKGVEINEQYFDIACERILAESKSVDMFSGMEFQEGLL